MKYYAIIVAGGSGKRAGFTQPKQFQILKGKPMILWSMEAFLLTRKEVELILVLPKGYRSAWKVLCERFPCPQQLVLCEGGPERYHSVKNGLNLITNSGLVAVHDAARPLISPILINQCYLAASASGAAIPILPLRESLGTTGKDNQYHPAPRNAFFAAQTPQCFHTDILHKAYQQEYQASFTDDASIVYAAGYAITPVTGEAENMKITYPEDFSWAEALLQRR